MPAVVPPASPPPDREQDPGTDLVWACGRYQEITGRPDLNPEDLSDVGRQRPLDRPYLAAKLDLLQATSRAGGLHNPRGFLLRALERDWTPATAPASRHRSLRPHRPKPTRPTVSAPAPRGTAPGLGLPEAAVPPVAARDAGAPAQLVAALVQLGVVPSAAERLVRAHPDEVGRQLGWIGLRYAQVPAALIVRAIGESWPEPATARQERMAEAEREQTRAQLAALDEARRLALSPAGRATARRGFAHIRELLSGEAGSPPSAGRTDPSSASCSPRTAAGTAGTGGAFVIVQAVLTQDTAAAVGSVLDARGWAEAASVSVVTPAGGGAAIEAAARVSAELLLLDVAVAEPRALLRYRLARPGTRIVLLAPGRRPGDRAVAAAVQSQVYDIADDLDHLAPVLDHPADFAAAARWLDPSLAPDSAGEPRVVERTLTASRAVPVSRRTCAVAGPKGGVGRTTVAVNLAVAAAALGRSVLVVDLHAGVWSAARHLGCAGNRGGLLASLADPTGEGIRATAERRHGVLGRGRDELFPALDQEAVAALCRVAAQAYDLVVLDAPPAPDDPGTYAALGAADQVFLTCDPADPVSVESAAALALLARDLGRNLGAWHLVCNRQRPGAEQPETVSGYFRDLRLPIALATTMPDESERHIAALRAGRPVAMDDPGPSPWHTLALTALGADPRLRRGGRLPGGDGPTRSPRLPAAYGGGARGGGVRGRV